MCCRRHFCQLCPRTNGSPHPRRIELYAGRGRKENASAFLARGRGRRQAAEAGAYLRSKYADSPRKLPTQNGCDVIESQPAMRRINGTPNPRRIELCAGRGRKENATATQGGTRFPNGGPGGKCVPESALRLGRGFRMAHQVETASRNPHSEWDAFSGWAVGGKLIPESALRTGRAFPTAVQAESASRNPASNWDALSAPSSQLQNLCALHSKTG